MLYDIEVNYIHNDGNGTRKKHFERNLTLNDLVLYLGFIDSGIVTYDGFVSLRTVNFKIIPND